MTAQRFAIGDRVRTRARNPEHGHTRLPRYLCGRRGVVESVHGLFPLADERALGVPAPKKEALYTVVFDGAEVWGDDAAGRLSITADLWDEYLEPERDR